jgi:predicted acylesterase/phospholipase RssA
MAAKINIGLTFYGGVSLAVYEAGVAEEFIRFVQFCKTAGSTFFAGKGPEPEVCVLSGSSAGGLASVLMSATLVNSSDPLKHIERMRRIWFDIADIANLQYEDDRKITSLLDNDILEREVQEFLLIREGSQRHLGAKDLKMLLTGTNMQGFFDAIPVEYNFVAPGEFADKAFPTIRHTEVFEFTGKDLLRAGEQSGEGRETRARIAKAARVTSSFPAAFPPQFTLSPGFPKDTLLQYPDLRDKLSFWYFDGGVLDNKPLGHAIDHMETNSNEGEWWFFFVDPDPEKAEVKHRQWGSDPGNPPDPARTLAAVFEVRGAETIYHDLRRIQKINHQVMQMNDLIADLWKHLCGGPEQAERIQEFLSKLESSVITARIHRFLPDYLKCVTMLRYRFGDASGELRKKQEQVNKAVKPFDLRKIIAECRSRISDGTILGRLSPREREDLIAKSRKLEEGPAMQSYEQAVEDIADRQLLFRQITFWVEDDHTAKRGLTRETEDAFARTWKEFETVMQRLGSAYEAVQREIHNVLEDPAYITEVLCFVRLNEAVRAASGIETREPIQVVKLYHDKVKHGDLAGSGLGHFAGFLDSRWRRNDYLMGIRDTREMLEGKMDATVFSPAFWTAYDAWHLSEEKRIQEKYQLGPKDVLREEDMKADNLPAAKIVPQAGSIVRTFQKLIRKYKESPVFKVLNKFKIPWFLTAIRAFLWLVKQATAVPSADGSDISTWSRFKAGARKYVGFICIGIIIGLIISFFLPDALRDLAHFLWGKIKAVVTLIAELT